MRGRDGSIRWLTVALVGALAIAACTPAASVETSTSVSPTTTEAPTTTTQAPTTIPSSTTTEAPVEPVEVTGEIEADIARAVAAGLTALRDPRATGPVLDGLVDHHAGGVDLETAYTVEATSAELADGSQVAAATLDNGDVLVLADEGSGWTIVGTNLASVGADPWFGESPRRVLVLGSDARPGGDPLVHRMDSIHVLTSSPADRAGTILGYPRDSWIESPYGPMRVNALTSSGRGPDAIFQHFTETWEVPVEGWIVTGFAGFEDLVAATLGRIKLDIPISIPTQEWFAGFRKGEQELNPTRALDFSRTRKLIPGGDFTRSYHQGIVMLAALTTFQGGSIHDLPMLVSELTNYTWTSLSATDLIQLGAAAMDMDIGSITNEVLPGTLGRTSGGASVVFLDPGFEQIVEDVVDDGLRNGSAG